MPHSTEPSIDSHHTFDLGFDDNDTGRPMTSNSVNSVRTKGSTSYGVALTSTPSHDERVSLPSQRDKPLRDRRKSAPGTHTFADVMENGAGGGDIVNGQGPILQRQPADRNSTRSFSYNEVSKRKSQYYEEQFQYKDNVLGQTKEKVQRQSPVIAELKTNVIIKDEFTLVTDMSYHLAQRYTRPDSSIMIRVDHSACLALGGNFEPCYILTINTVPSQMGPSTNKRNATLIQHFMNDILSVPAERGIVTFVAIPEENLAHNGRTILDQMERVERVEKQSGNDVNGVKNSIADAARKSMTFSKKSTPMLNGDAKANSTFFPESGSSKLDTLPPQINAITTPGPQLFELASTTNNKNERPSTAHGAFAAENGLRLNGISTDQLVGKNSRLPNGRPKTFGAPEPASVQESLKREPLPHVSSYSTSSKPQPILKQVPQADPKKAPSTARPATTTNGARASRPVFAPTRSGASTSSKPRSTPLIPESRAKNTYLDGLSSLTKKGTDAPAITVTKDSADDDDDDDTPLSKIASANSNANTSKRRSTITATPKYSGKDKPMPPPPPVPKDETRSVSSKLGKRKSFLKMFKRNSVPAWYDQ